LTEKQAYKILMNTPVIVRKNPKEYTKALHIAMSALNKQIAKRPVIHGFEENKVISSVSYTCPTCRLHVGRNATRCSCGQALLWGGDAEC
jgi:hypothetical protein